MKINQEKRKKRIGIDARFYGPVSKGIGRYIQEVVDNVVRIDTENEYVIFLKKENFDEFICEDARIKKVIANIAWYGIAEQLIMPFLVWRERVDIMHYPHFNVPIFTPTRFVVTIHDLILTKFPTIRATTLSPVLYKIKNIFYKLIIQCAVKRAEKIIAVSEFTKKDIIEKFNISEKKIEVIYEGVANLARGKDNFFVKKLDDKKTLLSYNINSGFLLYVGSAYPHKNLEMLVDAFVEFIKTRKDIRLVLVGSEDYFYSRLKAKAEGLGLWHENVLDSQILFTGYVPDAELEILYKKAVCYIFPSLYEGFGLPPLEAMAKECPVLSSNVSSMPEILGDAALYFDPNNKDDLLDKINKITTSDSLREVLIKKGRQRIRKYSWWECALSTIHIYKNILEADDK